jgi:hypothetical protein
MPVSRVVFVFCRPGVEVALSPAGAGYEPATFGL